MFKLFCAYLVDLSVRAFLITALAAAVAIPLVFAGRLERGEAFVGLSFVSLTAAIGYALRFGANLSWLQLAPISRARLWSLNLGANLYPVVFTGAMWSLLIWICRSLPASVREERVASVATARASESDTFIAFFGPAEGPYLLMGVAILVGAFTLPWAATVVRRGSPREWAGIFGWGLLLMIMPRNTLTHAAMFVGTLALINAYFARASAQSIGLPARTRHRFYALYGAQAAVLIVMGLFAIV